MKAIIGLGEIKELLKTDKAMKILLAAGAAIILLIALSGLFGKSAQKPDGAGSGVSDLAEYERGLEKRLTEEEEQKAQYDFSSIAKNNVIQAIKNLDLGDMSPRDAYARLAEFKEMLK